MDGAAVGLDDVVVTIDGATVGLDDNDGSPRKRARETNEKPDLSDLMRLARSLWFPTDPHKQRSEQEEDRDFREWFGCSAPVALKTFYLLCDHFDGDLWYLALGHVCRNWCD